MSSKLEFFFLPYKGCRFYDDAVELIGNFEEAQAKTMEEIYGTKLPLEFELTDINVGDSRKDLPPTEREDERDSFLICHDPILSRIVNPSLSPAQKVSETISPLSASSKSLSSKMDLVSLTKVLSSFTGISNPLSDFASPSGEQSTSLQRVQSVQSSASQRVQSAQSSSLQRVQSAQSPSQRIQSAQSSSLQRVQSSQLTQSSQLGSLQQVPPTQSPSLPLPTQTVPPSSAQTTQSPPSVPSTQPLLSTINQVPEKPCNCIHCFLHSIFGKNEVQHVLMVMNPALLTRRRSRSFFLSAEQMASIASGTSSVGLYLVNRMGEEWFLSDSRFQLLVNYIDVFYLQVRKE